MVVTANWSVASLTERSVAADGSLGPPASIGTNGGPDALAVDPTGTRLYVGGAYDNTVATHVIRSDGTIAPLGPTVPGPSNITGVAVDSTGTRLYAIGWDSGNVLAYGVDPTSGALTAGLPVPTGLNPGAVAIDPAGKYVLTTTYTGEDVWLYKIDASGNLTMVDRQTPCATTSATSIAVLRN